MAEITVLALGGHRTGTTSVLSLMEDTLRNLPSYYKGLNDEPSSDQTALQVFEKKRRELSDFCSSTVQTDRPCPRAENPHSYRTLSHTIGYHRKRIGDIRFIDAPGDSYDSMEKINQLYRYAKDCQVILITIDTPLLMENTQSENRKQLYIQEITTIVTRALEDHPQRRLVLFVPTKCEYKYHDDGMKLINRAVKNSFEDLIEFLSRDDIRSRTAAAIVPVLTMGGVVFTSFDESGQELFRNNGMGFSPRYPELAMQLVFHFFINETLYSRKKANLVNKMFAGKVSPNVLKSIKSEIGNLLNSHDSVAFELLQDPLALQIRRKLADFNILMFGARRTGKSSILASMIDSFNKLAPELRDQIRLEATPDTKALLQNKKTDLEDIFKNGCIDRVRWTADENPTDNSYEYEFEMYVRESKKSYTINFMDIPGERLKDQRWEKMVLKELNNCQIIIIAIDTPHMMEEKGIYHDSFNITRDITRMIKSIENHGIKRLFLFVPIKCEKYFYENRMGEVQAAIEEKYRVLLNELKKGKRKTLYTVAITPILSLGGVVFDCFEVNAQGFIERVAQGPLRLRPKAAYYKLYEKNPHFSPRFCEQPVMYLLYFILRSATARSMIPIPKVLNRIPDWFVGVKKLREVWTDIFTDTPLLESANQAKVYLKTTGDGYKILQDAF